MLFVHSGSISWPNKRRSKKMKLKYTGKDAGLLLVGAAIGLVVLLASCAGGPGTLTITRTLSTTLTQTETLTTTQTITDTLTYAR